MSMTNDQISEFQFYLQMYDRGLISKKTLLSKIDIVWEDEQKEIEIEKDIEFNRKRRCHPPKDTGGEA